MRFEANLAGGVDSWALRAAGLEVDGWGDVAIATLHGKAQLPTTLRCRYLTDGAVKASITLLALGGRDNIDRWRDKSGRIAFERVAKANEPTRVRIEIDDNKAGRAVQQKLEFYSFENDGELTWWKEHSETWEKIDEVLARDGLSSDKLDRGEGPMLRTSVEALIELSAKLDPGRRNNIHSLFTNRKITKKDWPLAVGWLIKEFERDPMLDDQLSTRIYELTVPAITEDLIRFIKDRRYGDKRWPLCLALAKTKHPKAADVIASILGQGVNTRGALEALAKLPAQAHVAKIKKYLRDSNGDVRRQAKKALAKLGVVVETPPPPVHVVKNLRSCPKGLEEWSANLDLDELAPTLKTLATNVDSGFSEAAVAEVVGVAEELAAEKTKTFRFPVKVNDRDGDIWIQIFMDDIDSPDVTVYAAADVLATMA